MNKICLFGASGHGKVIKELVESEGYQITAFIDDNPKTEILLGIPVLNSEKAQNLLSEKFLVTIGDNLNRKKVCEQIKVRFITTIHKSAIISILSSIDIGTVVMAGTVINAEAKIGKHCIINTGAVIEHDCEIKDYVHVSPNATITGGVCIGEGTHIGAGAIVIPNITIGKWCTIGAGTVIIDNVPDFAVVVGSPGKIIKYNNH